MDGEGFPGAFLGEKKWQQQKRGPWGEENEEKMRKDEDMNV